MKPIMDEAWNDADARRIALRLLSERRDGATICPSEVARELAADTTADDWRTAMPLVHTAIDGLLVDGLIRISWKGRTLKRRYGPYRIGEGKGAETLPRAHK